MHRDGLFFGALSALRLCGRGDTGAVYRELCDLYAVLDGFLGSGLLSLPAVSWNPENGRNLRIIEDCEVLRALGAGLRDRRLGDEASHARFVLCGGISAQLLHDRGNPVCVPALAVLQAGSGERKGRAGSGDDYRGGKGGSDPGAGASELR